MSFQFILQSEHSEISKIKP